MHLEHLAEEVDSVALTKMKIEDQEAGTLLRELPEELGLVGDACDSMAQALKPHLQEFENHGVIVGDEDQARDCAVHGSRSLHRFDEGVSLDALNHSSRFSK